MQVLHQLAVTGKAAADVAVLICGQELQVHRINRDDALIAQLIELEQDFWRMVTKNTAPPADGSESAERALQRLYPQDSGESLVFATDPYLEQVFQQLLEARSQVEREEQRASELKQAIQQRMAQAEARGTERNARAGWSGLRPRPSRRRGGGRSAAARRQWRIRSREFVRLRSAGKVIRGVQVLHDAGDQAPEPAVPRV